MAKGKQRRQAQRLQSAQAWLSTYEGKNVVRGYRRWYGVDWPTAFRELEMLGVTFDPAYKEQALSATERQAEARRQRKQKRSVEQENLPGVEQDEHFAFIAGYTGGGAPYGLTWEEWGAIDSQEEEVSVPGLMTLLQLDRLCEHLEGPDGCHFVDAPGSPDGIKWDCDGKLRLTRQWLKQRHLPGRSQCNRAGSLRGSLRLRSGFQRARPVGRLPARASRHRKWIGSPFCVSPVGFPAGLKAP